MALSKIFGIGFHKTGTTSLAEALKTLGYRVSGPNGVDDPEIKHNIIPMVMSLAKQYDAFQDNPWPIVFREMDEAFPGSKFILTIREKNEWVNSVCRHFGSMTTPMREFIYGYGCPKGNEAIYLKRFEKHNKEVIEYFSNRPEDLLIMDITKGDGWEKLCGFLNCRIPNISFPHANQADLREKKNIKWLSNLIKKFKKKF